MYGSQLNTPRQLFQLSIFFSSLQFHVQKKKSAKPWYFSLPYSAKQVLKCERRNIKIIRSYNLKDMQGKTSFSHAIWTF